MSQLQQQLLQLKKRVEGNLPPAFLKVLRGTTEDLVKSGIEGRVLDVGTTAPAFDLENQDGEQVDSARLLEKGPLVVTFYRGFW